MAFADHSEEERDQIYDALVEIVDRPFVPNGREVHTCQSFRWPSFKSRVSVIRYA
jgi:hypothetical protein